MVCKKLTSQVSLLAAWNLMNEPRNEHPNGAAEIQSWITQVAPYLKSLAPNQLVTVGEDGFYQPANCQSNTCAPFSGLTLAYHSGKDTER